MALFTERGSYRVVLFWKFGPADSPPLPNPRLVLLCVARMEQIGLLADEGASPPFETHTYWLRLRYVACVAP